MRKKGSPKTAVLERLQERLREPKPGLQAQLRMVTVPRPGNKTYLDVGDACSRAGVLVLLYPWKKRLHVVLTKRTKTVAHHQDQISFPGGRIDHGESPVEAALREAKEELGIDPAATRILGELTPLYVPPSNYTIYPVVATMNKRPPVQPSPDEVAEVIEIPLLHLLDAKNIRQETWLLRGMEVRVPFYFYQSHKIWGATAMILAEFMEIISPLFKREGSAPARS